MTEDDKTQKVFKLPPMPDDAIEFGKPETEQLPADVVELADLEDQVFLDEAEKVASSGKNTLSEFITDFVPEETVDTSEKDLAVADMVVGDPVIIDDPMPTPVDPTEEFDPSSTQNALDDFDEEGGARRVTIAGVTQPEPRIIKSEEIDIGNKTSDFNPGTVQNALLNNDTEGGIISNKSTGSMKTENGDSATDGRQIKESDKIAEEQMYRVYGFTVQYQTVNASREKVTVTKPVSDFFKDEVSAMISVNGKKYLMPGENGTYDVVDIVSGVPYIAFQDQNIYTYVGGKLGEGGYWKK